MTWEGELVADIVGQADHGVCAIGTSPWDAFEHIERLEHICQIVLASGVAPQPERRINNAGLDV
jgi:L-fuculose-phosphate aldolase